MLHAPNVHVGGGRVLIEGLLAELADRGAPVVLIHDGRFEPKRWQGLEAHAIPRQRMLSGPGFPFVVACSRPWCVFDGEVVAVFVRHQRNGDDGNRSRVELQNDSRTGLCEVG